MVKILMMSAKVAMPGLRKINIFKKKGSDVIIVEYDVINEVFSRESNYIVNAVMWPKFDNCSISMREVITTSIL